MTFRIIGAVLPLAALVSLPIFLAPHGIGEGTERKAEEDKTIDTLVVISPHTEPIKYEFARAFEKYYLKKYGRRIEIDYRNVGGGSDIVRYVNARYEAAFRIYCENEGLAWDKDAAENFRNGKLKKGENVYRDKFLDSDVGIGIDVFFGGGTYDQNKLAISGIAVDSGTLSRHGEYFSDVPSSFSGEKIYDEKGRFFGTCLSSMGIAYNPDRYSGLSIPPPKDWIDLTRPELFGKVILADPTKSGSITKCYELIIQQAMGKYGVERGWEEGLALIRLAAANSLYVTDSAGEVVSNVSSGAGAAGMCIDFYGLSEAEWNKSISGSDRLVFVMPEGGSSVSADPVQLLRGAPNRKQAEEFIDFIMSEEGQKLWIQKAGTPDGPEKYTLLRSTVKQSLHSSVKKEFLSNPDYDPYVKAASFQYHQEWTGRYFDLIRILIKSTIIDPQDDLREAMKAILANGGAGANPEAMALLKRLPFSYADAASMAGKLKSSPVEAAKLRREWMNFAMKNYRLAAETAKKKGGKK